MWDHRTMRPERASSVTTRYGGALACAAAALLVRGVLGSLLTRVPYFPAYIAILLSARYFGMRPTIIASVITGVGTALLSPPNDWARFLLFFVFASLAMWIVESFRRARAEAERSKALAEERYAQLQEQVDQRRKGERLSSQLRAIVESSDDAIISKDLDGNIQSWNRGAEQVFGYTAEEAIGRPIKMLLPPERLHEESDIVERIRRGGRVSHFETVRVRKDGKQIHVSLMISPMRDPSGVVIGAS